MRKKLNPLPHRREVTSKWDVAKTKLGAKLIRMGICVGMTIVCLNCHSFARPNQCAQRWLLGDMADFCDHPKKFEPLAASKGSHWQVIRRQNQAKPSLYGLGPVSGKQLSGLSRIGCRVLQGEEWKFKSIQLLSACTYDHQFWSTCRIERKSPASGPSPKPS